MIKLDDVLKKYDNSGLHCSQCKAEVNMDDNFCQYCGAIFNIPDDGEVPNNSSPAKHNNSGINYNILILLTSLAISVTLTCSNILGNNSSFGANSLYFGAVFIIAEIFK